MFDASGAIIEIEFDNDNVKYPEYLSDSNPHDVKRFCDEQEEAGIDCSLLRDLLAEHEQLKTAISKDDLKEVYTMLKNREIHPKGIFDKQGRFYIADDELVDVRSPSSKYPYSQMNAGRTSKFVKAMAEKYKVQSKEELISLFKQA